MLSDYLGGGGVGKSYLIRLVSMWTEKILRLDDDHPHKPKILLLGPTGVSASLIGMKNLNLTHGILIL